MKEASPVECRYQDNKPSNYYCGIAVRRAEVENIKMNFLPTLSKNRNPLTGKMPNTIDTTQENYPPGTYRSLIRNKNFFLEAIINSALPRPEGKDVWINCHVMATKLTQPKSTNLVGTVEQWEILRWW